MQKFARIVFGLVFLTNLAVAQKTSTDISKAQYASMAPVDQYLMTDEKAEIALARTAAPPSISDQADVFVLQKDGYHQAAKGSNGFLCIVERGWSAATTDPEFWNPKVRAPICFNPAAAKSLVPVNLMKTKLALAGKSKEEIATEMAAAFRDEKLPQFEPGSMCYMLSKQQHLNDRAGHWHPHLMFFVKGDAAKSWGADLTDSPIIAANDPEDGITIMMVWVSKWSDGSPAPEGHH
jgi:hypothetical protein